MQHISQNSTETNEKNEEIFLSIDSLILDSPKIFTTNDFSKPYNESFINESFLDFNKNNQNQISIVEIDTQLDEPMFFYPETIFPDISTNFTSLPLTQSKKGKQLGRKRKKAKKEIFCVNTHDNKCKDNLIKKIKGFFHKYILTFINHCLMEEKLEKFLLKKIKWEVAKNTGVIFNKQLLEMNLKEVLSFKISDRYKKSDSPNNIKNLAYISKKSPLINSILNLKYKEVYNELFLKRNCSYLPDKKFDKCLENIYNFHSMISSQKNENYKNILERFATNNFLTSIMEAKPRKVKKIINV